MEGKSTVGKEKQRFNHLSYYARALRKMINCFPSVSHKEGATGAFCLAQLGEAAEDAAIFYGGDCEPAKCITQWENFP